MTNITRLVCECNMFLLSTIKRIGEADVDSSAAMTGIDRETIHRITEMNAEEIARISRIPMLFTPSRLLIDVVNGEPSGPSLLKHASAATQVVIGDGQ